MTICNQDYLDLPPGSLENSGRQLTGETTQAEPQVRPVPRHVAIIMDGNRRWATLKGLPTALGHLRGAENLLDIVEAAAQAGVDHLTVFSFSTENWKRDPIEVKHLFSLMQNYLSLYRDTMIQKGVRLQAIGDLQALPTPLLQSLQQTIAATSGGKTIDLVLALNYGARDEILRATRKIAEQVRDGILHAEEISEELFSKILDTGHYPDPDLIIRTSGEFRLSNFLLWQAGYAEVIPVDVLWPDFSKDHFNQALTQFCGRQRRFGV
jgi:undecaprenyl diphosphate synthase